METRLLIAYVLIAAMAAAMAIGAWLLATRETRRRRRGRAQDARLRASRAALPNAQTPSGED